MNTRTRSSRGRRRPTPSPRGLPPWLPIAIIGAVVLVVAIVVIAASQGDDEGDPFAFGEVEYDGAALPLRPSTGADPAVGMTIGTVSGTDTNGEAAEFANGAPRALMLLAHWCGHCQDELDALNSWLADGNEFPDGVEIQVIATWSDSARPNFPPGDWLADNDWDHPTVVDDRDFTLAANLGLAGTPMWIFVDADGTVLERAGALSPEQLAARLTALAA